MIRVDLVSRFLANEFNLLHVLWTFLVFPHFQILASAYEHVGGRDFTEALVQHFMKQVKEKSGKPEIDKNLRVVSKVRIQMGKTKETLSASKDASFTLQYLDTDFDFSGAPLLQLLLRYYDSLFLSQF